MLIFRPHSAVTVPPPLGTARRIHFRHALLIACGSALLTSSSFATPTEELTRAVAADGISETSHARPKQFLKAFTAVAMRTQPYQLPDYVVVAIHLRPDLSSKIVNVAVNTAVKQCGAKPDALSGVIDRIIRAAIAANPAGALSIVRAAAKASPELRNYIVAAAISAAPDKTTAIREITDAKPLPFTFLIFSVVDTGEFSFSDSILNPSNVSDFQAVSSVNSPEQPSSY